MEKQESFMGFTIIAMIVVAFVVIWNSTEEHYGLKVDDCAQEILRKQKMPGVPYKQVWMHCAKKLGHD